MQTKTYRGPAKEQIVGPVTECLVEAFGQDPVMKWFVPDDTERAHMVPTYFHLLTLHPSITVQTCEEGKEIVGAMLTTAPGVEVDYTLIFADPRFASYPFKDQEGMFERIAAFSEHLEGERQKVIEPDSWRVLYVAIFNRYRGRGIGSKLLEYLIQSNPKDYVSLETSQPRNVSFYSKLGFKMIREFDMPGEAPHNWVFLHDPFQTS